MGNSMAQMEPYSKVIEGNLERGNDVLAYCWDKHKENNSNINIKEHLSNGSTVIYQSYANIGLTTHERENKIENNLETKHKLTNKNSEASSAVVRNETVTSSEKIISEDLESRGQIQTLHQDLLVDVVYCLRSLFITYLNTTDVSFPSRNSTNPRRSVSFNFGENPKRYLSFISTVSSSVSKVKKRSSIRASSKDDVNKVKKDDNSICEAHKEKSSSSDLNYQCNLISDNQIVELTSTLKRLFGVDEISIIDALDKAEYRERPKRRFSIEIVEGRRLRSKAFKDTINPYCIVRIGNDNDSSIHSPSKTVDEIFKSSIIHRSTEPLWNGRFNIDSADSDMKLCFEVWHSPLEKGLAEKIHLKGLKKESRNLIGYANIYLQDKTNSMDEWLKLVKRKQTDTIDTESTQQKERGEIRVRITEIKDVHLTLKDKQNLRSLLYTTAQFHAREIEGNIPFWCGSLSSSETLLIESYCKVFNISSRITSSSWWLVLSSEQINISQKFLFSLIQGVTECLEAQSPCEEKEGEELVNSVISWISLQITKLKMLETFYPSSSEVNSKSQLTYSLRTLKELEEKMPPHVLNKTVHPFNLCISEALEEFLESWWKNTLSRHQVNGNELSKIVSNHTTKPQGIESLTGSPQRGINNKFYRSLYAKNKSRNTPSRKLKRRNTFSDVESSTSQVQHQSPPELKCQPQEINVERDLKILVECLTEAYKLLQDISKIYNPVLYREYKVPFYRQAYIYLSNELSNLIQPLLSQLYILQRPVTNLQIKADPLALEVGSPVYEIYKFIRKIEQLNKGYEFSTDIQLQSGFNSYWKWLSKGLKLWMHRTFLRAKRDLIREVQEDSLNQNQSSYSAKSALDTHDMILNAWVSLKWPEEDQKSEWLFRLSEILCSLSLIFCRELRLKTEDLDEHLVVHEYFRNTIEKQLCFAISNIAEVTEAVKNLPEKKFVLFSGFEQDRENILRLVNKTYVEMNLYSKELMGKLIEKVLLRTEFCLKQSCDMENISSFEEFLCDEILGKKNFLCEKKFKEFLNIFLEENLSLMLKIIHENKERKGHLFFGGLSTCLEKCLFRLKFEYPEITCDNNDNYKEIIQNLNYLKLSNELLALSYFKQRYREQMAKKPNYYIGQIAVRAFFKMNGTLSVNVILAKDIHVLQSDILKSLILGRPVERKDQIISPSSYVVIKVIPTPKSSKFQSFRTKVQKKTSNPVYDSTFEFNLGCTGMNSREGFLVHSIFNKDCCSIDRLIGEALLPLNEIPCLPSPKPNNYQKSKGESSSKNCDNSVLHNVFLNLTYPRESKEYIPLQVLKLRNLDKNT